MTHGHFVWSDLSTYDMAAAKADYADLFGWSFKGDGSYNFATLDGKEVAAIFPMPQRLAEMDMPSFWMSYVRVDNVDATVAKARTHADAIIEVEPQPFSADARIALIRDPSGAGFTVYEGPDITPQANGAGHVAARYHHVPDIALIEPFYNDLFGWRFEKTADTPWPVHDIRHPDGSVIARAEEVPEEIRGKYRYWIPCFAVQSVDAAISQLKGLGGDVASELIGGRILVADQQGAHFMIRAVDGKKSAVRSSDRSAQTAPSPTIAWKAIIGLCCIWLAVFFDVQAFWGVLFLIWTWPAIRTGRADFIEPVSRARQPVLFWALVLTWIVLSVWLIVVPPVFGGR